MSYEVSLLRQCTFRECVSEDFASPSVAQAADMEFPLTLIAQQHRPLAIGLPSEVGAATQVAAAADLIQPRQHFFTPAATSIPPLTPHCQPIMDHLIFPIPSHFPTI